MKKNRLILTLKSVLNKCILYFNKDHATNPTIEPLSVDNKLAYYLKVNSSNYPSCKHNPINFKLIIKTGSLTNISA
jgi:hypothetical protein